MKFSLEGFVLSGRIFIFAYVSNSLRNRTNETSRFRSFFIIRINAFKTRQQLLHSGCRSTGPTGPDLRKRNLLVRLMNTKCFACATVAVPPRCGCNFKFVLLGQWEWSRGLADDEGGRWKCIRCSVAQVGQLISRY